MARAQAPPVPLDAMTHVNLLGVDGVDTAMTDGFDKSSEIEQLVVVL